MYIEELNSDSIDNVNRSEVSALNSANIITPMALDGKISQKTLSGNYTGTQDIDYYPINYTLLVEVKCDVYSDNLSKQIVGVNSDGISSYLTSALGSYTQIDSWYTIPSSGKYVKVGGQGHLTIMFRNRIIPFSVTIYL